MKITTSNKGGIAEPDVLKALNFCCREMNLAIIEHHQLNVRSEHDVVPRLTPSKQQVKFCPFCGVPVEYIKDHKPLTQTKPIPNFTAAFI